MKRSALVSTKPPKCPVCHRRTGDVRLRLHSECVEPWIARQTAKQDAAKKKRAAEANKRERAQDKAKLEKFRTPTQLLAKCREIVQEIARIRDCDDGCISCHMEANYGGRWHGSHFRPAGNHSAVELHLWNIHKSCAQCNLHKGGNIEGYRPRLIEKIGLEKVAWLEAQNQVTKRTREYLLRFIDVMGRRLLRMKKRKQRREG